MKLIELPRETKIALLNQLLVERPGLTKAAFARGVPTTPNSVTNWTKGKSFPRGEEELRLWRYWGFTGSEEVVQRGHRYVVVRLTESSPTREEPEPTDRQVEQEFVRELMAVIQKHMTREEILGMVGEKPLKK